MSKSKNVTIQKRKKKKHPFRTAFSFLLMFAAAFLLWTAGEDFITTMKLKKEISNSQNEIVELEKQQTSLQEEKKKLEDPNYVVRYARGKYMFTKPGEQIFKLPAKNTADSEEEE